MTAKRNALLCIRSESSPERCHLLESSGYAVSTADTEENALALVASLRPDAVILEYSADSVVARAAKEIAPEVLVVMIVNTLDLPASALDSVDALVANYDGPQFLLETLHYLLKVKPGQNRPETRPKAQAVRQRHGPGTLPNMAE